MNKIKTKSHMNTLQKIVPISNYKQRYTQTLSTHPLFTKIYKQMRVSIQDIIKHISITHTKNKQLHIKQFLNTHLQSFFISDKIKKQLQQSITSVHTITVTYKQHTVTFYNFCHKDKTKNVHYKQWTVMAIYVLCIAELYNITIENLQVYMYPSTFKKVFPKKKPITTDNVNSGYTARSINKKQRYIVLFRKEDIENVFVHECIHYLDIEHKLFNHSDSFIKTFFTIQSSILLSEGYTEILTILYVSICNSILLNIDIGDILYNELLYGLLQSNKVFSLYAITGTDTFTNWKDDTNTFAYVIIKTVCLYHIDLFLDLFFDHTNIDSKSFSFFIIQHFKSISHLFFNPIHKIPSFFLKNTFKKSIYDISW